jgi:hypothetical protein
VAGPQARVKPCGLLIRPIEDGAESRQQGLDVGTRAASDCGLHGQKGTEIGFLVRGGDGEVPRHRNSAMLQD